MKILALDTSTEYCSTAVWRDGAVVERDVHAGQSHSELLLGMVHDVLSESGLAAEDLDAVAYGAGPGTFTGLRIGCGVAQGLAYGAGCPVIGIGTLLALATGSGVPRAVCCIDARMQQVYYAVYEREDSGWKTVHEPALYEPAGVPAIEGDGWTGLGSGFIGYRDALAQRYGGQLARIVPEAHPRARDIAQLAVAAYMNGEAVPPDEAAPWYIRDKVALKTDERTP
ncbi:MAG TPA: tRNA (adenosine(37)-N6)-threonylcarbamoyltransferase complex dimerization subunit type 1 TsaB [Burkholderiales bacterium]|nr:tRNA (adenosine(37)-N6)-threonylcarbamoyltransferase complex dimerization subunit type 1 TsaB [Burkholderiales bacterium]